VAASIRASFDEAAWHQPSIVLLDDLDQIVMACSGPDQEMSSEALYHGRIAQCMFFNHQLNIYQYDKSGKLKCLYFIQLCCFV